MNNALLKAAGVLVSDLRCTKAELSLFRYLYALIIWIESFMGRCSRALEWTQKYGATATDTGR